LGLTLEYLETKGVEVIGYQTKELPAFYTRESGFQVNYQLNTPEEIAQLLHAKWSLNLTGGIIVANPIPKPYSMDSTQINQAIEQAVEEANLNGIKGNEVTPYLLSKIKNITEGSSLESNIELVYNNARLAAKIACAYVLL
jgi:pseudouridylate synthase